MTPGSSILAMTVTLPPQCRLDEWVYGTRQRIGQILEVIPDKQSLTPIAIQRSWKTPGEFPTCPDSLGPDPLGEYADRLEFAAVFSKNAFGATSTVVAEQGDASLSVLCKLPENSVKAWRLTKVTVENEKFVHESIRTFFSLQGALKEHCKLLDIPFEDSIDDYS